MKLSLKRIAAVLLTVCLLGAAAEPSMPAAAVRLLSPSLSPNLNRNLSLSLSRNRPSRRRRHPSSVR